MAKPILGGLHHEHRLEKIAARIWIIKQLDGNNPSRPEECIQKLLRIFASSRAIA